MERQGDRHNDRAGAEVREQVRHIPAAHRQRIRLHQGIILQPDQERKDSAGEGPKAANRGQEA